MWHESDEILQIWMWWTLVNDMNEMDCALWSEENEWDGLWSEGS